MNAKDMPVIYYAIVHVQLDSQYVGRALNLE